MTHRKTGRPRKELLGTLPRYCAHGCAILLLTLSFTACSTIGSSKSGPDDDIWAASYDATTQTRYIPLELIIGARWNGKREIALPKGTYVDLEKSNPSTWQGPVEWQHPDTGKNIMVYERSRRGVAQKFAIRKDADAIGFFYDSRSETTCDQQAKFPLGYWKQGEIRQFEYRCWQGRGDNKRTLEIITTIAAENIDFTFNSVPHSLQIRWDLKIKNEPEVRHNFRYVFSPDYGLVSATQLSR